jgi:molybdate transport system ATP-binding protein
MKELDSHEVLAVIALGPEGQGARLLSRMTRKSWDDLGFAPGQDVFAQVKSVALAAGRRDAEE